MNQKSRKTGSRVLACLLAVLMLLSTMSGAVSALRIGSTVNVSGANEWISGFYYDWNGNFGMGGKYNPSSIWSGCHTGNISLLHRKRFLF